MDVPKASKTSISSSFFDSLWPLILEDNVCEIKSKNTIKFFVPECQFDNLWAHTFLAKKQFKDYNKPLEFPSPKVDETPQGSELIAEEVPQLPYRTPGAAITPLDQLAAIERDVKLRQKLAYDFANRTFSWYIQRPSYEFDFAITEQMKKLYSKPFEYEILSSIQRFQCNLMIIDVAVDVGLNDLERWLKFSPYVAIVAVVHYPRLYRQLRNFDSAILPTLMEDNLENTWHDELNRALKVGIKYAQESYVFQNSGKAFAFVFSNNRSVCTCDKFKILKKC